MKNFKSELIFHFNKSHIDKLRNFIKETNNKNLSIITKNPRRFLTIDYNDSSIGFNIDKDFLKKHPKNDFLYLVFNADETNNLDEWLNYAFSILDYENNQELFNLQIDNSTLSLCLYADTDFDIFNIGLSRKNLELMSKFKIKVDIDFYHHLD